jgi:hypothetical protein
MFVFGSRKMSDRVFKKKHKTMSCHILYDLIDEKTKGEKFYLILALSAITNISIALTL